MTVAEDLAELDLRLTARAEQMEATILARLSGVQGGQCTAENHHPGKLAYHRGPNTYHCQCGQVYRKDGKGGLTN